MVCPNCHSDQVIAVQDQHFCINCGQAVPEETGKTHVSTGGLAVQENGLPEGVKILSPPGTLDVTPTDIAVAPTINPARPRLGSRLVSSVKAAKPKRKKPGRPKSGRLDVPRQMGTHVSGEILAKAPQIRGPVAASVAPTPPETPPAVPKLMNDISPRAPHQTPPAPVLPPKKTKTSRHKIPKLKAPKVHKVGIPPLHYGHVIGSSLRARLRPRHLGVAAAAAISMAVVTAYAVWELLTGGLNGLATTLMHNGVEVYVELVLLACIYYVGRSIGQSAITTSIIRESDHRPIAFTRALGTAVNTFGSRLLLDLCFGVANVVVAASIVGLLFVGGSDWPVNIEWQLLALFCSFLVLLYLLMALTLSRGLAGVATTLTNLKPLGAARMGWRLFSHRFELMGLRFVSLALELLLAVPLAVVAIALACSAPASLHLIVALSVGILAWIAGALLGAGSAAWWAMLYRNLVMADHPDNLLAMLSGRQPVEARPGPVALVAVVSTFLLVAVLAVPWLRF
jgi:hypothetical protein